MTSPTSDSLTVILSRLDARVRRVDEERWLSSRYAAGLQRETLIVLYAFYYELARVRLTVSDRTLGQIRFQWWREALTELDQGTIREHDVVFALAHLLKTERLNDGFLKKIVDQFETAFLDGDRGLEPETDLALAAVDIIAPGHKQGALVQCFAPIWARLRRGEPGEEVRKPARIPSAVRPALAHFRLRRPWARGRTVGRIGMRFSILLAILTGSI